MKKEYSQSRFHWPSIIVLLIAGLCLVSFLRAGEWLYLLLTVYHIGMAYLCYKELPSDFLTRRYSFKVIDCADEHKSGNNVRALILGLVALSLLLAIALFNYARI
jgi:hypothetical protein